MWNPLALELRDRQAWAVVDPKICRSDDYLKLDFSD